MAASYVALRPRLLFSYPGKPPALSGAREINELAQDDVKGWRYIFELCGGEGKATKRTVESKMTPVIGPFDWGDADLDKPMDLGRFFGEVAKMQTGQRWVALNWAHAQMQGHQVQADPKSVLMTRPRYVAENYARTPEIAQAEARALLMASEIENAQRFYEATSRVEAAENQIMQQAAYYAKNRSRVVPVIATKTGPVAGRNPDDIAAWRRLFDFVDKEERGTVSKAKIQSTLAPLIGAFEWHDDHDETPLTFVQFLDVMMGVESTKRYMTLAWARNECPEKVHSMDGRTFSYVRNGVVFSSGPKTVDDADVAAWWKLFNLIDENKSGIISRREIDTRMAPMVGSFDWEDANADGRMDFGEFVNCMNSLPLSKKYTCLRWAQTYCPDETQGRPAPAVNLPAAGY